MLLDPVSRSSQRQYVDGVYRRRFRQKAGQLTARRSSSQYPAGNSLTPVTNALPGYCTKAIRPHPLSAPVRAYRMLRLPLFGTHPNITVYLFRVEFEHTYVGFPGNFESSTAICPTSVANGNRFMASQLHPIVTNGKPSGGASLIMSIWGSACFPEKIAVIASTGTHSMLSPSRGFCNTSLLLR